MATISKLQVELSLLDKMSGALSGAGKSLTNFGRTATMAVTVPLLAAGVASLKFASDLAEQMSATDVIFGTSAGVIQKWSTTSATSFGLSRTQALQAANQFGALGISIGLTTPKAIDFSTSIVQAAADLGSFFNVDPGTVLQDIQSGLAGQSEPLRFYNIYLNETAVSAEAMRLGLVGANGEITEGAKVQARYSLIMAALGPAQGNFALTADGAANSMRIASAQFKDAAAVIGTQLLPVVTQLIQKFSELVTGFQNLSPQQQKMITLLAGIAAVIGPLALVLGFVITNITAFGAAIGTILAPLTAASALLVVLAPIIVPITAALGLLKLAGVDVGGMFTWLGDRIGDFVTTATEELTSALDFVTTTFDSIKTVSVDDITSMTTDVLAMIGDLFAGAKAWLDTIELAFSAAWDDIKTNASDAVSGMAADVLVLLGGLKTSAYNAAWSVGYGIGQGLIAGIDAIWDSVVGMATGLANTVVDIFKKIPFVHSPSKVTTYVGKMIGEGLIVGMDSARRGVTQSATGLAMASIPSYGGMGLFGGGSGAGGGNIYGGLTVNVNGAGDPHATGEAVTNAIVRAFTLREGS